MRTLFDLINPKISLEQSANDADCNRRSLAYCEMLQWWHKIEEQQWKQDTINQSEVIWNTQ